MNRTISIKKISLFLLAAAILSACNSTPPPKAVSEVMSPEAMAKTVSSNRKAQSKSPGAVLRDNSIQSVNNTELAQPDAESGCVLSALARHIEKAGHFARLFY